MKLMKHVWDTDIFLLYWLSLKIYGCYELDSPIDGDNELYHSTKMWAASIMQNVHIAPFANMGALRNTACSAQREMRPQIWR